MSKQEIDNMNNNNIQSKFYSNLHKNGQMVNSNENNFQKMNPLIINNAVINNFNNINQMNNNFSENKNNLNKNVKNKILLKSQGAYKKNIIKSNLNSLTNHNKNPTNKTAHIDLAKSKKHIEEILGSPYKPKKGVQTAIINEKKIKPNNLLKSMKSKEIKQNNIQNNFAQNINQIHNINNPFRNMNQQNNLFNNDKNNSNMNQQIIVNNPKNVQNNQKNNFPVNPQQINMQHFQQLNKISHINKNQNNISQNNLGQNNIIISNINNNNIQNSFKNQNQVHNINQSNINVKKNSNSLFPQTNKINQKTNQIIKNVNQQKAVINQSEISNNKINSKTNKYSFSNYKLVMTGLKNLGNTSYLNSVLQLLGNIRSFASYFLNPENGKLFQDKLEKYPISFVTHRLCFHLYTLFIKRGREIYTPDSYMCMLGNYNWIYKDYKERDPRMVLVYILNKLHDELNKGKSEDNDFIENNMKISQDRNSIINLSLQNMMKYNNSIIFNYFNWCEIKETKCMNCSNEIYDFLNFSTFELNIFDLARYKRNIDSVKLEDCLDFYSIPKIKKKYCYSCKDYKESTTTTQIFSSPNIFIFLLNLENTTNDEELDNINFVIEKQVDLGKYIENKSAPLKYELIGMVYLDKIRNKYCTLACSPIDFNWFLYEDENVCMKSYDTFMQQKFNKSLYYKPCILVYKSIKN